MSLSRKHINTNKTDVPFEIEQVSFCLQESLPSISFAFLLGSAQRGVVKARSDFDLAIYLKPYKVTLELYSLIEEALASLLPGVRIDTGLLNRAEPVYRFESLKGTRLFVRDMDEYSRFFSLTCREYESQMFDYERQLRYRRQAQI